MSALKNTDKGTSEDQFEEGSESLLLTSKKHDDGEGVWLISYADMMTLLMGFFALIASFSKVDSTEFEKVKKEATKYFGGQYEVPYGGLSTQLQKAINDMGLAQKVVIESGPEGVTMTFQGTLLFESGSFKLKDDATLMMQQISEVVFKEAKNHNLLVEGHTDNLPITTGIIASNWELSGLRAARVARLFEGSGFKKEQISIVGWGETKPIAPNSSPEGEPIEENRSKNRRVLVKIYKNATL